MKLRWTKTPEGKWTQARATEPAAPASTRSPAPGLSALYASAVAMMFGSDAAKVRASMPRARA